MRNIDIEFLMTSLDSKASFKTRGELKENRIIFNDDEGNRHFIILQDNFIEYHKRGSMNMKYVFNVKHNTTGRYEIEGNTFLFVIKTRNLRIKSNEIIVNYDLLLDDEKINESTLLIKYR